MAKWIHPVAVLLGVFSLDARAVTVEQIEGDHLGRVRIENRHFVVELAASSGARICSGVGKEEGAEQVWWRNDGRSGMLDD